MMRRLSANLGYFWRDLPLLERIDRAANAGFPAVEFHDDVLRHDREQVREALERGGIRALSVNTDMANGFGKAAIRGREAEARRDIEEAALVAEFLDAPAVHVLAGISAPDTRIETLSDNLAWAVDTTDRMLLIEPISDFSVPNYFVDRLEIALSTVESVGSNRVRILFDCFHLAVMGYDVSEAVKRCGSLIGHVQIASYPGRMEPGEGSLDYGPIFSALDETGYQGFFGCEYHPRETVEAGLGWVNKFSAG